MSIHCKPAKWELSAGSLMKAVQENSLGGNCARKWARLFLHLFSLAIATILLNIWFLKNCSGVTSVLNVKTSGFFEDTVRVFSEQAPAVQGQCHANQISFCECRQVAGSEASLCDSIGCAPSVPCLGQQEVQQTDERNVMNFGHCAVQDDNIAMLRDMSITYVYQSVKLPHVDGHKKNNIEAREMTDKNKEHCKSLHFCFPLRGCCILFWFVMASTTLLLFLKTWRNLKQNPITHQKQHSAAQKLHTQQKWQSKPQPQKVTRGAGKWRKKLLILFVSFGIMVSIWVFWLLNEDFSLRRTKTLSNMCDERARMLQDQFNVSMNHVHALAILVSTFHHGKHPSAIDQKTFGEYTKRTDFERPLTSGVAYALKVLHSERQRFEKQQGWTIKKMETGEQTLVQNCTPENWDPAPIRDEYAPVIFSQETLSHIVSIDMMSGKEDHDNILRARASGKGVLTSPFKLLKSSHLGVVLTFAVYKTNLPPDATPQQRIEATVGYLGASYDVPSLVDRLLHQLASEQTISVNVYDTTNSSARICMYGSDVVDTGLLHVSTLNFGDPLRKHEMHCRFKQKAPLPWTAIISSFGGLVITFLVGHIFRAAINRIIEVENDFRKMKELKVRAEAADVAKSQFLATVSHEIRTPMNGVLGMLQMLMDTDLDAIQRDYAQTAHTSGNDLISLINEVLDQAKIESGRLELEAVPFNLRAELDNVLSLFSGKSNAKGIELAIYVSDRVPQVVIGDPSRFRQIITNLVGNSIKFTQDQGHIFVSLHLADQEVPDEVLKQGLHLLQNSSDNSYNTLSGFPVVDRLKSWKKFEKLNVALEPGMIRFLVTVEDTGVGIPVEAQHRIFTPFMQADSSTSRTYGGTGIGLSISKRLVELMDGEIGFASECGTGSTFSFTCVFRNYKAITINMRSQICGQALFEFEGLKALVIDRRSIRAEVARYNLQRLGISVDTACSLKSACSYLASPCNSSAYRPVEMILIEKDVWDKESKFVLQNLFKYRIQNGSADIPIPKIFLLATSIDMTERSDLISTGFVADVLLKPLRLSVLTACFQESFGSGKKRQDDLKNSTLGTLLKRKQILIVDDNLVNRRVAEGALRKYGAIITCVESGKAALKMLQPPHNYDACFMDLRMPEMDGFEATCQIRHMEKLYNEKFEVKRGSDKIISNVNYWRTPILAMTADVIQATDEECMKCGMDGYVSKPFEEAQLYLAVARFFSSE